MTYGPARGIGARAWYEQVNSTRMYCSLYGQRGYRSTRAAAPEARKRAQSLPNRCPALPHPLTTLHKKTNLVRRFPSTVRLPAWRVILRARKEFFRTGEAAPHPPISFLQVARGPRPIAQLGPYPLPQFPPQRRQHFFGFAGIGARVDRRWRSIRCRRFSG